MTFPMLPSASRVALLLAPLTLGLVGCSTLKLPGLSLTGGLSEESRYKGVDGQFLARTSIAEQSYHSVRRALAENAIVLEVEREPSRVLPLPADGRTVYVSDLIRQGEVIEQVGSIEATLLRHSATSIGGLPMEVQMASDGKTVRPETDYALQAGDRLVVHESAHTALQGLVNTVLGL